VERGPETLRATFEVLESSVNSPWWFAQVTVCNLDDPTTQNLLFDAVWLTLEAGYQTGPNVSTVIWDGPVLPVPKCRPRNESQSSGKSSSTRRVAIRRRSRKPPRTEFRTRCNSNASKTLTHYMAVSPIAFRHNLRLPAAPAHAQARGVRPDLLVLSQ
jgi:hypothetical protein